ncbi:MAG: hypothetical protein LC540_17490 [Candidatus Thiodiazotropha sp.]|nr:hypothetical protein [Candidatus Thiodiazotropha sp.]
MSPFALANCSSERIGFSLFINHSLIRAPVFPLDPCVLDIEVEFQVRKGSGKIFPRLNVATRLLERHKASCSRL